MRSNNYYVYITTNPKRTVLYTGVTNDLTRRLEEHLDDAKGVRKTFAGRYFCYNLIYYEWYAYINDAISRETEIKGWVRRKKEALIGSVNPKWCFLNTEEERLKGGLPDWF